MILLAVSLEADNNMVMGALLIGMILLAALLIGSMAVIKGWIREVAGVKETTTTEIADQPLMVQLAEEFMTKNDHGIIWGDLGRRVENLERRSERADARIETVQHEILRTAEDRAIKLHDRINDIDRKVAGLEERTTATNTTLAVQDKKLDAILEKL